MNINPIKIGISAALSFSLLWVICSIVVHFSPQPMMLVSGHMVHANLSGMSWTLTWTGFLIGLVAWAGVAAITAWLTAIIYNTLNNV